MADIELVIKIPQFIYEQILKRHVGKITIAHIFKNGTPLPKGHGRLIDADVLEECKVTVMNGRGIGYGVFMDDVRNIPTIIGVDKGDKE